MYYFINVKIFSVVTNKISQQQRANTPPPIPLHYIDRNNPTPTRNTTLTLTSFMSLAVILTLNLALMLTLTLILSKYFPYVFVALICLVQSLKKIVY